MSAILSAVAAGEITPAAASSIASLVENFTKVLEVHDLEQRISKSGSAHGTKKQRVEALETKAPAAPQDAQATPPYDFGVFLERLEREERLIREGRASEIPRPPPPVDPSHPFARTIEELDRIIEERRRETAKA